MDKKEFKKNINFAIVYFMVFYIVYIAWMILQKQMEAAIVSAIAGVFIFSYILLLRPYKYMIEKKQLYIYKRIGKPKEVNLMTCETISDPIPKMTKIITSPHVLEIYTEGKKRIVVAPKYRVDFVYAVKTANKRIHVQVKEYAEKHRGVEKKYRKERKKHLNDEKNA